LALGEGDAAGDGLTAGLGAIFVSPLGEGDGEELTVPGEFDSFVGSLAQPAASRVENIVSTNKVARLIDFKFGVVIIFPHRARLKSAMMIAPAEISSNGRSHRGCPGISARAAPKPSLFKRCLHD
jgi:hypothetical protein